MNGRGSLILDTRREKGEPSCDPAHAPVPHVRPCYSKSRGRGPLSFGTTAFVKPMPAAVGRRGHCSPLEDNPMAAYLKPIVPSNTLLSTSYLVASF